MTNALAFDDYNLKKFYNVTVFCRTSADFCSPPGFIGLRHLAGEQGAESTDVWQKTVTLIYPYPPTLPVTIELGWQWQLVTNALAFDDYDHKKFYSAGHGR